MNKRQKIRKLCVILVLAAAVLAALIGACWRNLRKGVSVGDKFYYRISDNLYRNGRSDDIRLQKSGNETEVQLMLDGKEQRVKMLWSGELVTVTYEDGTVLNGIWDGQYLCDEDRIPVIRNQYASSSEEGWTALDNGKRSVSHALCMISQGKTETRGSVGRIIAGVIVCLVGGLTLLFPNETYFFLSGWAYKEPELSEMGVYAQRISGVVIMIVGIVIMYIGV